MLTDLPLFPLNAVLFPGTGFANDVGGPNAQGTAVNVAVPPGTGDSGVLRAVHAVVPQLLRVFAPDALVTQHGCDGHREDPLTNLTMSVEGQRQLALVDQVGQADATEEFVNLLAQVAPQVVCQAGIARMAIAKPLATCGVDGLVDRIDHLHDLNLGHGTR